MANEASLRISLQIENNNLKYRSHPVNFNVDVTDDLGPTPGLVNAATTGTNVDLSALTTPALCRIENIDQTNYATFGIWDPEINKFYPLGEVGPGEFYVLKLSRDLAQEIGTGTGTTGPETNRLQVRGNSATVPVVVHAFET